VEEEGVVFIWKVGRLEKGREKRIGKRGLIWWALSLEGEATGVAFDEGQTDEGKAGGGSEYRPREAGGLQGDELGFGHENTRDQEYGEGIVAGVQQDAGEYRGGAQADVGEYRAKGGGGNGAEDA
jgi:hypothetical protein